MQTCEEKDHKVVLTSSETDVKDEVPHHCSDTLHQLFPRLPSGVLGGIVIVVGARGTGTTTLLKRILSVWAAAQLGEPHAVLSTQKINEWHGVFNRESACRTFEGVPERMAKFHDTPAVAVVDCNLGYRAWSPQLIEFIRDTGTGKIEDTTRKAPLLLISTQCREAIPEWVQELPQVVTVTRMMGNWTSLKVQRAGDMEAVVVRICDEVAEQHFDPSTEVQSWAQWFGWNAS